jgi:FKBP12-rapamycin complex-associated protein
MENAYLKKQVFLNCCMLFLPLKDSAYAPLRLSENSKAPEFSAPAEATKMTVNQQHLKQAWDTSQISTREDWSEWIHRLGVEFMKESPSHALRACMSLVDTHPPLAKELFNAAFLSCWGELYDQYQVCFLSPTPDLALMI